KTKFSATEAGQAFEYMAMAGWKTGDMLDGIEGIMNLAAASGEDLATTSDIVTDALTAFGMSAEDSGHFADVLAAASSNANTNVSMLGESFKYAAPVAGALGISAEDTSLALGLMANAGIKATQSGTALRTGLTNLAKPSKDMQTYMDKYSIALVKNADGSINLRDTMVSLREKMGALSETEQAAAASAIFGKNSMAGWLAIINSSDQDFEKLTSAIDNCDGSAARMAETMQDNLAGQITILKSSLQELMIQIGDALMPTIRSIVGRIQDFVLKLQQLDDGTRNTILRLAAFAAAIGPVLLVVGKLTAGVGKGMKAISSMGKSILTFVNEAKLGVGAGGKLAAAIGGITAPVAAVIAVVAVLTAAFVHLWNTNEEFRNKVTAVWDSVKAKFSEAAGKITDAINSLGFNFSDLGEAIKSAWDWFCNALEPIVTAIVLGIGRVLESLIDTVTGIVQIIAGISGSWQMRLSTA
ncbi:MAG: phage tail tape measure protein, partial [Solobacterium sp.]|nr:phage tail tape measure protein [Solobacterium sp.]